MHLKRGGVVVHTVDEAHLMMMAHFLIEDATLVFLI